MEILGNKDTRSGFGEGLAELGAEDENIVALCADLTGSLKMNAFQNAFPNRFFQVGIAEANMISLAAGMTIGGKIPFTGTFANFSTGRVYDQIRQSVAYSKKNVKICASHAGLTLGEDGATHQILEDIGMMRMLPNMTVVVPADFNQTKQATKAIAKHDGPVYLRFGRPVMPIFVKPDADFQIGKAQEVYKGTDVTIIACGHMVWKSIEAVKLLTEKGISVELINMHTIKPLDISAILNSVSKTGCIVTAEEHMANGGLGEAVAQVLSKNHPCPHEFVAVDDSFGESGKPMDLLDKYGLGSANIVEAVERAIGRKN
ncbi:transketolase family protein [Crocinitomicaceae bacterium]|nr:transketolase family protein [Crocinitomicaceae bacterium]